MKETQLLKDVLEGCILSIISKSETYGYKILSELEHYIKLIHKQKMKC